MVNSQIGDAVTVFLLEIGFQTMNSETPFYFEFCQGRWLDRISQSPQQNLLHLLPKLNFDEERARQVIFDIWKSVKMFTNIFDNSPEKLCESVINSRGFQKNDRVKTTSNKYVNVDHSGKVLGELINEDKKRGRNKLSPKKSRLLIGVVQESKTKRPHLTPVPFPFQIFLSHADISLDLPFRSAYRGLNVSGA